MKCHKCKQTLRRLMILALLEDAGAKCSPAANDCPNGGEHDFQEHADEAGASAACGHLERCW